MSEKAILEMLLELVRDAVVYRSDPDDHSGCNTTFLLDQEQLMRNIEARLEGLKREKTE